MNPAPKIFRITDADSPRVPAFMKIFRSAFPFEEQREMQDWRGAFADPLCHARVYENETETTAILVFWAFGHCRYVEYFALAENARGNGLGSAILENFIREDSAPVVLEIEPPHCEKNIRRQKFYERLGFRQNAGEHLHPPYHAGFPRERLVLLNHGSAPLSAEARERFIRDLENRAMRYAPAEK